MCDAVLLHFTIFHKVAAAFIPSNRRSRHPHCAHVVMLLSREWGEECLAVRLFSCAPTAAAVEHSWCMLFYIFRKRRVTGVSSIVIVRRVALSRRTDKIRGYIHIECLRFTVSPISLFRPIPWLALSFVVAFVVPFLVAYRFLFTKLSHVCAVPPIVHHRPSAPTCDHRLSLCIPHQRDMSTLSGWWQNAEDVTS